MRKNLKSLAIACLAAGTTLASASVAAEYPEKPIEIVIPFPAGGSTDTIFRTIQPHLAELLKTEIVLTNTKGAGGAVGYQMAADAQPDGYTFGTMQTNVMIAQAVGLGKYTDEDYEPVVSIGDQPLSLAVKGDGPYVGGLTDYQAAALENPGKVDLAMGVGSLSHFVARQTANKLDVDIELINAGGGAAKKAAVLENGVAGLIDPPTALVKQHANGELKVIAVFAPNRLDILPDVPTAREQGVDLVAYQTKGFFAPKGTPEEVKARFAEAVCQLSENPELQKTLKELAVIWRCISGNEYESYIDGLRNDMNALAKQMGY